MIPLFFAQFLAAECRAGRWMHYLADMLLAPGEWPEGCRAGARELTLADVIETYALPPPWTDSLVAHSQHEDDSLRPLLVSWLKATEPASGRAEEVEGWECGRAHNPGVWRVWCRYKALTPPPAQYFDDEPAARRELKRCVLSIFDDVRIVQTRPHGEVVVRPRDLVPAD